MKREKTDLRFMLVARSSCVTLEIDYCRITCVCHVRLDVLLNVKYVLTCLRIFTEVEMNQSVGMNF